MKNKRASTKKTDKPAADTSLYVTESQLEFSFQQKKYIAQVQEMLIGKLQQVRVVVEVPSQKWETVFIYYWGEDGCVYRYPYNDGRDLMATAIAKKLWGKAAKNPAQ